MKAHIIPNRELRTAILEGLRKNDGYCISAVDAKGKEEYKCVCHDFVENVPVGESCRCGLYIKDEM